MAKTRTTPPAAVQAPAGDEREMTTVRMYESMHARLRVICQTRKLSTPDALEAFAAAGIDREYRRCVEEMNAALQSDA